MSEVFSPGGAERDAVHETTPARVELTFIPSGKKTRVPPGVSVFDAASWNGVAIDSTCGGHGTCRKCKVKICDGSVPVARLDLHAFSPEEIRDGWRLACLARANADLVIDVPPLVTRPKAATVGVGRQVILRPAVQKRHLKLSEPLLHDQVSDIERVLAGMDDLELHVALDVVRSVGPTLRAADFEVTAVIVDDELIEVEAGDTTEHRYGMAFDLGTTTVVATLLDLSTGTPVEVASMLNKQQPFGADVISRISAIMLDPGALPYLRDLAQQTLDELAQQVCGLGGVDPRQVYQVALAGNATMVQIALGIDPEPVGVAPFIVATRTFEGVRAADLGIRLHPQAPAVLFPAVGAYVGGDIVAGVLAAGMDRDRRLRLFIDVGTNCEIVIAEGDRLVSTSAPAGPAFEAASIRCGMRAAPGAIELIRIGEDDLEVGTIDDEDPIGLCGSGLVDAVAELVRIGLVDPSGRFITADDARDHAPALRGRLTKVGDERVFVLHWRGTVGDTAHAVYLSQRDIRELQFAKAAISTGWRLLLEDLDVDPSEVQQVLLAGSFGTYLAPASAIRIGLVPKLPVTRIVSAGNVAGEGAKMVLLSSQERAAAHALREDLRYVELSDRADFNDRFVDELAFPV